MGDGRKPVPCGRCYSCNKVKWQTRSDAKKVLKTYHPMEKMRVYPCPSGNGFFHLGHAPAAAPREGAREAYVRKMREP